MRALSNALTTGRVHHAFLFAGTRGVGKTTVARILARCLNCEQGVTAEPCGSCAACKGIEEGRFVDLIEVDAASRTGIDDIRELLDNVQYTPASGRFKIYLIDEIHMLSKAAFNALLKTLEEPPPHVKFLFATTDPERLPVTVLSRCLQFNLKRLPFTAIVERMAEICTAEGISADAASLGLLARAGGGSMRDSLSLLDQALAFGNGQLRDSEVAEMLGTMDRGRVIGLLELVAQGDVRAVIDALRALDEYVPDYQVLLGDIAAYLQRVALIQLAGEAALDEPDHAAALSALASSLDPETTQLYYEIAVQGRRDIDLAPDPQLGFEMVMLRMLAFRPLDAAAQPPAGATPVARQARQPGATPAAPPAAAPGESAQWSAVIGELGVDGAARQLAMHCALIGQSAGEMRLGIKPADSHLLTEQQKTRLVAALRRRFGDGIRISIEITEAQADITPAGVDAQRENEAMMRARAAIESDPNVRELASVFGAQVLPDSVRPGRAGAVKRDS